MKRTKKILNIKKKESVPEDKIVLEPIPDDIIEFILKYRILKGKPFSFKDREYLIPIYREKTRELFILKARQMEITEMAVNLLLYYLLKNDGTYGLYMTDREDHVKAFANLMRDAINTSEKLKQLVISVTNSDIKFANGSILYMMTGWNKFEKARGYAIDFAVVDEAQSLDLEAFAVINETLSHSIHKRLWVIGTGNDEGSEWYKLWSSGTQMEWKPRPVQNQTDAVKAPQFSAGIG